MKFSIDGKNGIEKFQVNCVIGWYFTDRFIIAIQWHTQSTRISNLCTCFIFIIKKTKFDIRTISSFWIIDVLRIVIYRPEIFLNKKKILNIWFVDLSKFEVHKMIRFFKNSILHIFTLCRPGLVFSLTTMFKLLFAFYFSQLYL